MLPSVRVRGDGPLETEVTVEIVNESLRFLDGWSVFVVAEEIVAGDIGHFVLVSSRSLVMRLYGLDRAPKPMAARPVDWNFFVAYGDAEPMEEQPATAFVDVPGDDDPVPPEEVDPRLGQIARLVMPPLRTLDLPSLPHLFVPFSYLSTC